MVGVAQLEEWYTRGLFPKDLRVWRAGQSFAQSTPLTQLVHGKSPQPPPPSAFASVVVASCSAAEPEDAEAMQTEVRPTEAEVAPASFTAFSAPLHPAAELSSHALAPSPRARGNAVDHSMLEAETQHPTAIRTTVSPMGLLSEPAVEL